MLSKTTSLAAVTLLLFACATPESTSTNPTSETPIDNADNSETRPLTRPEEAGTNTNPNVPITVAEASKTSAAERDKATKPVARPEQDRGVTIATLGLLDRDGFWLATPLVKTETDGRIVVEKTGASLNVTLLPNGASSGSGSQLSIASMQILGIPITDLTEIRVFIR